MHEDSDNIIYLHRETHVPDEDFDEEAWWDALCAAVDIAFAFVPMDYKKLHGVIADLAPPDGPHFYFEQQLAEADECVPLFIRRDAEALLLLSQLLFAVAEMTEGRFAFGKAPSIVIDRDALQVGCYSVSDGHVIVRSSGLTGAAPLDGRSPEKIATEVLRTFSKVADTNDRDFS